jgi:hypothetical protein
MGKKQKRSKMTTSANHFTLKLLRFILFTLGLLSLVLVLFMAQRLEAKYGSFDPRLLDVRCFFAVDAL